MIKVTLTLKLVVLFIAFLTGSHVVGQDLKYYAFIPNDTGDIDRDGFDIGYHSVFSQWDLNGDGDISENEFNTLIFQRLDSNHNGSLSSKEWEQGKKYLFGQFINQSIGNNEVESTESNHFGNGGSNGKSYFEVFDTNNDNNINSGEFDAGLRNTRLFQSFDSNQNGRLDRKELNKGVYKYMDLNRNGIIEKKEFAEVRHLFID